jgi:ADP-ribose pyrophosphatase YjhB (NUDIX family)
MQIHSGDRVGRLGKIRLGCSAAIFDPSGAKILLVHRTDNGEWCLPGGLMEPGESVEETCIREVWEETGLHITVTQLVGVYSNPHLLVEYPDGNRVQHVSLCFAGTVTGGDAALEQIVINEENLAFGFFTLAETGQMPIPATNGPRIQDAFARRLQAFIR